MRARGQATKTITILVISLCATSPAFSQGEFIFNNVSPSTGPASANIGSYAAPGEGAVGAFLGIAGTIAGTAVDPTMIVSH